jgi:glutamyl-Q tRNA(Asp) synthetase
VSPGSRSHYRGRFAPSPTGPLHAGSLVAALASWLDARAHGGRWLLRLEDVDRERCRPGLEHVILEQLARCGLHPDEPPLRQSVREPLYAQALERLLAAGHAYPCACTRKDIDAALAARGIAHRRSGERVYPGTCRAGVGDRGIRSWRLRTDAGGHAGVLHWVDRRLGPQQQDVTHEVGDFVLRRADGQSTYQLAVVVDDAAQGISHIVRGEDLADNTPRQILLQRALGVATPAYLHTPLVRAADGQKLSKQTGAQALDLRDPRAALQGAAEALGLPVLPGPTLADWLAAAVQAWPWRPA